MKYTTESKVEEYFKTLDPTFAENLKQCKTQVLTVENYVVLGQLTALRFIEWVGNNLWVGGESNEGHRSNSL